MMTGMLRIDRILLAALLLAAAPAQAYQREEHYYSLRLALGSTEPRLPGDEVVALCAQLADEAPELNPIAVYRHVMRHPFSYAAWSLRDRGSDATVGRMVTVQQLLHGLTGGSSEAAHMIAADTAQAALAAARRAPPESRTDALCALGFSLHFYGDSFAHRRMHNPKRMYPTGLGHMFDGPAPDMPFYSPVRTALWREYIHSLKNVLPDFVESKLQPFFRLCEDCRLRARPTNAFGGEDLKRLESQELGRLGIPSSPLEHAPAKLTCRTIVEGHAAKAGLTPVPDCERSWALYRAEAERAYAAYDADAAHAGAPSRGVRRPFYEGPLFEEKK
jgi:hypothetical protein